MFRQSDAATGIDLGMGMARRTAMAFKKLVIFSVLAGLVCGVAWFWLQTRPHERGLAESYLKAEFEHDFAGGLFGRLLASHANGPRYSTWPSRVLATPANRRSWLEVRRALENAWGVAWPAAIGFFFGFWFFFGWVFSKMRKGHERGARLVTDRELARTLRWRFKAAKIRFGRVPMVRGTETQHTLIVGSPGCGKSVMLKGVLSQILEENSRAAAGRSASRKAIVFDPSGEYYSHFSREGDHLLNPFDSRSELWTPWCEMPADPESPYALAEAERIANIMVPHKQGETQPFWPAAARVVLANALLKTIRARSLTSLREMLVLLSLEDLAAALDGTEAGQVLASKEGSGITAQSVRQTLAPNLRILRWLIFQERAHPGREPFSIRKWIREGRGTLYISGRPDFAEVLGPLWTLWLDTACAALLSLDPDLNRRIWFVCDEAKDLGLMPSLPRLMSGGRRFGAAVILAYQSVGQLLTLYGHDPAREIVNSARTRIVMAQADHQDAEWAADTLGSEEVQRSESSYTISTGSWHGQNVSTKRETRRLVMPEEITHLKPLHFYVQLPGEWPVAKTRVKLRSVLKLTQVTAPLVPLDIPPDPPDPDLPELGPRGPLPPALPVQQHENPKPFPDLPAPDDPRAPEGNPLLPGFGLKP
ncbi:MAG: type IV secretion system DNA-binding domain-containing protein [Gammaproteobacteria bacterium]